MGQFGFLGQREAADSIGRLFITTEYHLGGKGMAARNETRFRDSMKNIEMCVR